MKWTGYISFHRYSYNSMLSHLLPLDKYGFILHLKLWSGNRPQKHLSHHLIVLTKVCLSDQPIIACSDNKPAPTIKARCMTRHWVRHFLLNSGAIETRCIKKTAINELQWLYISKSIDDAWASKNLLEAGIYSVLCNNSDRPHKMTSISD